MNLYEWNKMAGAAFGAALLLMVINEIGNVMVKPTELEKSVAGIVLDDGDGDAAESTDAKAEDAPSLGALLAAGDAEKGKKVAKKCAACHTFDNGGKAKIGPNLFNIPGKDIASGTFKFSTVLAGMDGNWSYENLDAFLTSPKTFAKGTKMSFAGLKKSTDRADIIAYLRQSADSPPALPAE